MQLKGNQALVTGTSRGIGQGSVLRLARDGRDEADRGVAMAFQRAAVVATMLAAVTILGGALAVSAWAQGNGPGFHAGVLFNGGCSAAFNQVVSSPTAPATAGPTAVPCISGTATAAGEAAASALRASSHSAHECCGTASASNGRARIQIENIVIVGPPAAAIPVSINFRMRGTLSTNPDFGQAGVSLFVALSGFNTLMQSVSAIDMSSTAILNQTGVFAPLALTFPASAIDQAFVTPVVNAAPNQPLRLDFELMAYSDMAGLGATKSDFFSDQAGVTLPFGVPVFNLPPGYTVNIPELNIVNNYVALPATIDGDIFIVGTNASEISLPSVSAVTGSLNVSDNAVATTIDLGSLLTVAGNVDVSNNAVATNIDLGALTTAGSVDVSGNTSATGIDLGELDTVNGALDVTSNGACTTVILGSLLTVTGDLHIESCGTGTFTPGPVSAGGNTTLDTTGYGVVTGTTAAGSSTISNATADARVTVRLPTGSFAAPTTFSLTRLDPPTLVAEPGASPDGPTTIDPIAAYEITFGVPTLNANATLTFDVFLAGLDAATAIALLEAVATGDVTLVTRADAIGGAYQAFAVCADPETPTVDGCVQVQLLDANGQPTTGEPAIVRFSGVVGLFSVWGVAFVTPQSSPVFTFAGLLPPYPAPPHDATPAFQRGRVIPLKFAWTEAGGGLVDSASAAPSVSIFPVSCASLAPSSDPIAPDDAGASGGLRYDADSAAWTFNWSTRSLVAGCYAISVSSGSPGFAAPASSFAVALRTK